MRAYWNVVDAIGENMNKDIRDALGIQFYDIINTIEYGGNAFYTSTKYIDAVIEDVEDLSATLKALGDRYTFYSMLVRAQKAEKEKYNRLLDQVAQNDGKTAKYTYVRQMPFGGPRGGTSGLARYDISTAVMEDIALGELKKASFDISLVLLGNMWEWNESSKINASTTDGSDAIFCKVMFDSPDEWDNKRELTSGSSPAVGKKTVGFYCLGGGTREAHWYIEGKSMRFTPALYPFYGLE